MDSSSEGPLDRTSEGVFDCSSEGPLDTSSTTSSVDKNRHLFCSLCSVQCSGKESYEDHFKGKLHSKTLRGKLSCKLDDSLFCDVCQVKCTGKESYDDHFNGKLHRKNVKAKLAGKMGDGFYCDLCRVECSGAETWQEHISGSRHQRAIKTKLLCENENEVSPAFKCDLCNVVCSGPDSYYSHVTGAKHARVAKLVAGRGDDIAAVVEPANSRVADRLVGQALPNGFTRTMPIAASFDEDTGEEYIEEYAITGKPSSFLCKLCDCKIGDPGARALHIEGRKHKLMLKKYNAVNVTFEKFNLMTF